MTDEPPQLRMGFTRFTALAPPMVPPGYGLRAFRPGDEEAWLAILAAGDFGAWDRPRLERMLAGERALLPREGIVFATRNDEPVGAACVFLHADAGGAVAELGWVAVLPAHRGRGLGQAICRAALEFVRDTGRRHVYLLTEEHRLPALRMYVRLGFEPELTDPRHSARRRFSERLRRVSAKRVKTCDTVGRAASGACAHMTRNQATAIPCRMPTPERGATGLSEGATEPSLSCRRRVGW